MLEIIKCLICYKLINLKKSKLTLTLLALIWITNNNIICNKKIRRNKMLQTLNIVRIKIIMGNKKLLISNQSLQMAEQKT